MYARVTRLKAKPERVEDMARQVTALKPLLSSITGLVKNIVAWRADGSCMVLAVYESKTAADAAVPEIQSILAGMAEYLAAPPEVETYDNAVDMLA